MSRIDEVLAEARANLVRVDPAEADALRSRGALLVDIRPHANRHATGEIPDALAIERIVLEWRLAPDSEHRIPGLTADTVVILYCNDGYASSLAARDLRTLGLHNATDLAGGFNAWRTAGLPIRPGASPAIT